MSRRASVVVVVLALVTASGLVAWASGAGVTLPWTASHDRPSAVVGTPAGVPAPHPPSSPPTTRLAVAGDTGTGSDPERATAQEMAAQARTDPYNALVLLGDLVYPDGDPSLVTQRVTDPFSPVLSTGTELVPVLGNHDYRSDNQQQILRALGRDRSWYTQRVGSVLVVVLDSNRVGDPAQTAWLRRTLAAPRSPGTWVVAAMHHPAYSAGHHGSDLDVRAAWAPLFAQYGVPLVLAGHDHDYQRSRPQDGVTYVVSGGGAILRPTGQEDFTAVSSSTLHYLDLAAGTDRLVGRAIDQDGNLVDTFMIRR